MRVAVYPGSFDPVTNGHLDIIARAAKIFDRVIVAIFINKSKVPLFTINERKRMLENCLEGMENVTVDSFEGLLVDYMKNMNAQVIVRGLRAVSDFEYEFQASAMNKKLADDLETIFMMTSGKYAYLSSSIVKEVASFGGCVRDLVPEYVEKCLREKFK